MPRTSTPSYFPSVGVLGVNTTPDTSTPFRPSWAHRPAPRSGAWPRRARAAGGVGATEPHRGWAGGGPPRRRRGGGGGIAGVGGPDVGRAHEQAVEAAGRRGGGGGRPAVEAVDW